jgi:anti-sigma regulatory factor (Ser/Thr protein kinase)
MSRRPNIDSERPWFECELPATNRSLARLRAGFAEWLSGLPWPRRDRFELVLALSELGAAAIRGVDADASVEPRMTAHAWVEDGGVAMEVIADQPATRREGTDSERGLAIVASITDALSVRADGARTLVCARKW